MCIVTMKTVTAAHRARKILRIGGISAEVVSLDASLTKNGCAYGIRYPCHAAMEVERLLQINRISYGEMIGG